MIEQSFTLLQEAAPVLVSLIFAGSAIALSIWSDADVYDEARRRELSAAVAAFDNSRRAPSSKETRRGHQRR